MSRIGKQLITVPTDVEVTINSNNIKVKGPKGELEYNKKQNKLICWNCRIKFPILDGSIPDMLIEDGETF